MVNYKVRESYRNTGLRCFKVGFGDFLENMGARFEDMGPEKHGHGLVSWGYYDEDIKLRVFHSGKVLHGVHVLYEGNNPDVNLKELRGYLEEMGLKKIKITIGKLEKEVEVQFKEVGTTA